MLKVAIMALSAKSYGGDSYFRAILPALSEYGGDAEFILLASDDRYQELCPDGGKVKLHVCGFPASHSGAARILWEQFVCPFLLSRLGADVVFTANNIAFFFSPVPCVIAIRNMEPLSPISALTPFRLQVRHKILGYLTKLSIKRAVRVVAVSHCVLDTLLSQRTPVKKIDVISHGVDDLEETRQDNAATAGTSRRYVASAAKFVRYANLASLMRGFAKMRALGYEGELRFAGGSYDRGYEREIRALVHSLGIESHVRFLGYIPRATVQEMIRNCDVFMFPSTLEACPFTLLEAMRQGVPIVVSNTPPMPEFCGDAAVYVESHDTDGWAQAACEIAFSQERRVQLGIKARERARRFTWAKSVGQLVDSLRNAACGS